MIVSSDTMFMEHQREWSVGVALPLANDLIGNCLINNFILAESSYPRPHIQNTRRSSSSLKPMANPFISSYTECIRPLLNAVNDMRQ
ncbi:hypothetical protein KSP39_PZI020611 [Platanthera zijinensis]|uniref:Uncharacterized protein n=1 Tax=Platanthera zijinensis TaxID=2320716 RepID=A0AAP0AZW2_9ASPA